ncbi:phytanoyl-CoA dioxygenase family protein [Streptosporangium saharense]|uniref:phytanoyl-CoA dioxygenase family protein n=1 Tax=Streptosporangium saharense TaxID=1706840 RepID=UPI003680577F
MARTLGKTLSSQELDFYRDSGYLIRDRLLGQEKFEALGEHFERKLASLSPEERPEDMDVPHFTDPELFRWLFDEDVLDLVTQIIGPDIAVFSSHFFCKPPRDGKSVPWHQDAYYWRETINPSTEAITIWLAIDPSTRENGCMRVVPGSHLTREARYRDVTRTGSVFDEELDAAQVDESRAVPVELLPGQASIHAAGLVHGSEANLSSSRRCGFTMRYISTEVRFNHEELGHKHQIYLARGVDRAGNVYADPTRSYPELIDNRGRGQSYLGTRRPGA